MTDQEAALAQWEAQMIVIGISRRRLERALPRAYKAGLARWASTGAVTIPVDAQLALAAVLAKTWRAAVKIGATFPGDTDADKAALPRLEIKAGEMTLFEQIMLDFISRFGAAQVAQILETTRQQLQALVDGGVRDGLGQEAIAKRITDAIPSLARTRARVIARTETHNAAMHASQEVAKAAPFPMNKRWVSVYDARTRDFGEGDGKADAFNHRIMNEVTVGPDELFSVPRSARYGGGFELMAGPGDPNGSAANLIGCRCALIYRRVGRPWPKTADA